MSKRKPKSEPGNEQDDSLDFIIGTGSFDSFTVIPNDDRRLPSKRIFGFVRPKKKTPKQSPQKRKTK